MRNDARIFGPKAAVVLPLLLGLVAGSVLLGGGASTQWSQWGGPSQNFTANSAGLAANWPEKGPPRIWTRELGDGYSAIVTDAERLYTMYREGDEEAIIALNPGNGKTIWEYRYEASPAEDHVHQFGDGPRSTPLLSGNRIYAIGVSGKMHCLNKTDGKEIWSHDLWQDFGGNFLNHGYSSSPIEYKNTVIALVGGENQSIVAFNKKNGKVVWKNQSFHNSYSTPKIMNIDGEEQLVAFMATELIGVDPKNGDLKWQFPHENQWKQNVNMPVMAGANHLFLSSPEAGARGLKLTHNGEKTEVEEVWSSRKIQFYHGSSVQQGDYVYGSTGMMAPAFMAAVNIRTGEIAWRKRGFAKANVIHADGKLIILDEDGKLGLATATPDDLIVHSEVALLDKAAWTVPTLVGKTLYVRDKTKVVALDLG